MTTVTIVKIIENGSDEAVYVDDMLILTADPGCGDSLEPISAVAYGLANLFRCKVQTVEHEAHEDWQWDEVGTQLVASGKIKPAKPKFGKVGREFAAFLKGTAVGVIGMVGAWLEVSGYHSGGLLVLASLWVLLGNTLSFSARGVKG